MQDTQAIMGMPITVAIADSYATRSDLEPVFNYFTCVDKQFSPFKPDSEVSLWNAQAIGARELSSDMKEILELCAETKQATNGYFDIRKPDGHIDPSGLVKGWAIHNAARLLEENGFQNYYVEAGGDIQVKGLNPEGENWKIGIRNPFNRKQIIKALRVASQGVATSGTYIRGQHIYNPLNPETDLTDIVSITVIGPNIYEADRFATAAFAMGADGIHFIEHLPGFEGYQIDHDGIATMTTGFSAFEVTHA